MTIHKNRMFRERIKTQGSCCGELWARYQTVRFQPIQPLNRFKRGAIISLCVPAGVTQSTIRTKFTIRRHSALLRLGGFQFQLLYGGNELMTYRELSAFVKCSINEAYEISRICNQNAFYWFERGRLFLCSTDRKQVLKLPLKSTNYFINIKLPERNDAIL
ncbi:hypothetical protein NI389_18915 (plasmid) [Pseudoalteromonas xiamenensis]|uniref:hypothetical protein n=1 Tax=Pseudoalteromonas xiamenensis TaxID=882626 RepID=UPI0027E4B5C4|nr:hypothetical protein [Pseudoalteromonas xiamenensis]WMN61878.1 hypothetical protein NI389_18915 [Pseudoalteromonas xiamenensis]